MLQAPGWVIVGVMPDEKRGLAVACRVMYVVVHNAVHREATPQLHTHGWVNQLPSEDFSDILFDGHDALIGAKTLEEPAGHVPTEVETADHAPARLIQTSGKTAPAVGG